LRDADDAAEIVRDARGHPAQRFHAMQFHQVLLIGLELRLRMAPRVLAVDARDVVRDSAGKAAFDIGPRAWRADVLVADDANDLAVDVDRRIEHRSDTERREVRVAQFLRRGRAAGIVRRDRAHVLEGVEVSREILRAQQRTLEYLVTRPLQEVTTAQRAILVNEDPEAHALHVEGARRERGEIQPDIAQPRAGRGVQASELHPGRFEPGRSVVARLAMFNRHPDVPS
jgi:hypothetical protein